MFLRFKISSIMAFAAVFAFANAMQGCSLAQPEKKLLRIEIPARADFAAKASASYSLKYADPLAFLLPRGTGALMAPGNISLFNCFALNVTGPDIPVDNRMQCKDAVDVVGIAGGTVPASGGIVEVMVPSGSNRKLELMGFDGTGTDCLPMGQVFDAVAAELNGGPSADPLTEPLGKPWLLAETVVDIVGDTTITMDVSQNTASARELFQSCGVQEPSPSPSPSPSASPSPSPTPTPTPLNVVISLSGSQPSNTAILPVEFTVSFSQVINTTTFDESDITQSGTATGVAWSLSIIDQMTYTLRATAVGTQGTIIPTIPASVVWDTSSNPNEASTGSATVAFDNVGPAAPGFVSATPASPSSNLNPLINGTSSSDTEYLRFYSEAACANEIGSGSKALFESTGITITLQPNQATSLYAVAFDSLSNASACTSMSAYTHDNTAPTVTITTSASSPTALSPIPVTVTFSEVVTGFGSGGVTVTNGSVGSFLGSGATYTFDLIPAANGFVTVDLAPGEAMDAAGNANSAAAQFSIQYTVDNIAPSFPVLTAPVADQVVPPGALKVKGGCETGATVTLSGVGTTVYATCIDSVFEATVDVTPGNGVRSLLVHQTDPAGNDSSSTSVSFNCLTSLVTIPQGLPGYSALPDNTVTAIYRDTTTVPPTLYVGTPGGLAISTDDGVSFSTRTTADGLGNNGVLGVVALGNQVFVATSNGLAVSNDNGVTFTKRMVGEYVRDVALQGSTLYVGTQYSGLKTTTDGGITFTQKTWSGSTSTINTVRVFGTTVLVGTSGGLGISVDNGASFVQRTFSGSNNVVS
ncbi:MAG TPA: hypothetical protein DCS07_05335, partial [Bdellovibrionales bacterium]|nr:hypothetical protein [Bdellovibrionales bacterium]